jgi:hypothetical protein
MPPHDAPLADLPRLDEHEVAVAAAPGAVWDAVFAALGEAFTVPPARWAARLIGCDPAAASGWDRQAVGSAVAGFAVVTAERPHLLVVAGRHRFSRYGIVVRIEPEAAGARCRAESRAAFPGPHGALYRQAVVGTGGHVLGVRRLLAGIRRTAEAAPAGQTAAPRRPGRT